MSLLRILLVTVFLGANASEAINPSTRSGLVSRDSDLWLGMFGWFPPEVPFKMGDNTIDADAIKSGISQFTANTCISFKEVGWGYWGSHAVFRAGSDTCTSFRGKKSGFYTFFNGQDVTMTKKCTDDPIQVLHQIADLLGVYHEQSRSDRDSYITVMLNNIIPNKQVNFIKESSSRTFGSQYDYTSVMHAGLFTYSSNGKPTMYAQNPLNQGLITAPKTGLSFMDKLSLNTAYGCIKIWEKECGKQSSSCQNMGYLGASCQCVCPEGTSGSNCGTKTLDYNAALRGMWTPLDEVLTEEGDITTTDFPTPVSDRTVFTKVINAPNCKQIKLTVNDFDMAPRCSDQTCCVEGLEVRLASNPGTSSSNRWYCGVELKEDDEILSDVSSMVLFYSKESVPGNTKTGFSATTDFIDIPGC